MIKLIGAKAARLGLPVSVDHRAGKGSHAKITVGKKQTVLAQKSTRSCCAKF